MTGNPIVRNPIVNGRYTVLSADCHGGAAQLDYRPYLDSKWYDEFDGWAGSYEIPFMDIITTDADRNWDSNRRLADLESDGIVGEVVFPNTVPPFFSLNLPTAEDCQRRWAGLQAHNRWLADFCAAAPGRRAGVAQLMLHDIDAAVKEVRWVRDSGIFGGVLLPTVIMNDPLVAPLYAPEYEPLWSVCEELGMTLHTHAGFMSTVWGVGRYPAAGAVYISETAWVTQRALSHLILAGVFERHPGLKLVMTEQGTGWVPGMLDDLDTMIDSMRSLGPDSPSGNYGKEVVAELTMKPSDYFRRNCSVGASFLRRNEVALRDRIGVDAIMWGSDYPHTEGTFPFTREALRWTFGEIDPIEVGAMLGGNAARVYGFDLDQLAPIVARVGPEVDATAELLTVAPSGSLSAAFSG